MNTVTQSVSADAERRFYRAWDEDGLSDLVLGLGLMIIGGLLLGQQRFWRSLFTLVLVFGGPWLVAKAKGRITDGRTGYVRPRRRRGDDLATQMLVRFAGGLAIFGVTIAALVADGPNGRWSSLLLFVVAALPLIGLFQSSSRRYLALILASLAAAAVAWRLAEGEYRWGLYALVVGAAMLVSGSSTLRAFLRRHPIADVT